MIDEPMVEQLTNDVCASMLGLNVQPNARPFQSTDVGMYCAHVGIEGNWQAQIFVICANGLAQKIASSMFMIEPDELSEGEIGDAIGELANMLGGNLKGVLPGENTLSLPSVEQADGQAIADLKTSFNDVCFECEGYPLTVSFSNPVQCETCTE